MLSLRIVGAQYLVPSPTWQSYYRKILNPVNRQLFSGHEIATSGHLLAMTVQYPALNTVSLLQTFNFVILKRNESSLRYEKMLYMVVHL